MMKNILLAGALLYGAALVGPTHAATITTLHDTGVDASANVLGNDVADAHYKLVSVPNGSTTSLRTVTEANGYPIYPWLADDGVSDWIGPDNDRYVDGPVGTYDYQTTFSLAGFDPNTASIVGAYFVDDWLTEILLNGVSIGSVAPGSLNTVSFFDINSGFVSGTNTLDFVVDNGGGPTGLRLEMNGAATLVPEPAPTALLGVALIALGLIRDRRA